MAPARFAIGVIGIAITLTAPGRARAQSCATDADCAKGLSCQGYAAASTAGAPCMVADGGAVCPAPPETTASSKTCLPAVCATDADCGLGMMCHGATTTACSTPANPPLKCDPASDCPAQPATQPADCTTTTTWRCAYQWELPCNVDADCGDGFTCKPNEIGMCSGGSATATAGSGGASAGAGGATGTGPVPAPADMDAGASAPVTCTTITSFPGYCQAKVSICTADADCPSAWTCVAANQGTAVASPTAMPDGGAPPPVATDPSVPVVTTVTTKTCQPPAHTITPTQAPTPGGDSSTKGPGTAGLSADGGAATATTIPPSPTAPGATNSGPTQTAASTSGGGCSVAAGEGDASSAWLALAALALGVRRRRL